MSSLKVNENINKLLDNNYFNQAMLEAHKMLDAYEAGSRKYDLYNVFEGVTRFYLNVPNSVLYITYMRRLIELYTKEDRCEDKIETMYLLAMDYVSCNEYDLAYITSREGMKLSRECRYYKGEALFYNVYGNLEELQNNYKKALEYYIEAYALSEAIGYEDGKRFSHNMGIAYRVLEDYNNSVKYLKIAYEYNITITQKGRLANTCNEYAYSLLSVGEHEQALEMLNKAEQLCKETSSKFFLKECYYLKSTLYDITNNIEKSYKYFKLFYNLDKEISKAEQENQLKLLSVEMDLKNKEVHSEATKRKNKELEALSEELKLRNEELSLLLNDVDKYRESLEREKKQSSLNRVVGGIAHQINTSIGNSMLLLTYLNRETNRLDEIILQNQLKENTLKDYISNVKNSLSIMIESHDSIVNFIDKVREIPIDLLQDKQAIRFESIIDNLLTTYKPQLKEKNIEVHVNISQTIPMINEGHVIEYILDELLTNAIKYAFKGIEEPIIHIELSYDHLTGVTFNFSDNGVGVSTQDLEHIFDPFYTSEMGTSGGSGLGLYFVSKLIFEVLNGTYDCSVLDEGGLIFTLLLPNTDIIKIEDII